MKILFLRITRLIKIIKGDTVKKVIFILLFGFFIPSLMAQKEPIETKMFFQNQKAGEEAFRSGDFRYYMPDPNNLKTKPPRLAKGLPCAYIALEVVRENSGKSPSWVLLPPGMPAEFNSDGMPIVDGRCWNEILEAYPLEKYVSLSMVGRLYGPPGKDGYTPIKGKDYFDGEDGTDGEDSKAADEKSSEGSWATGKTWGVIGGALVGGAVGGFGFPQKYTTKIEPSFVQSDNGTRQYGPERFKEEERFNLLGAITGAIIGGGLTYLILRD